MGIVWYAKFPLTQSSIAMSLLYSMIVEYYLRLWFMYSVY